MPSRLLREGILDSDRVELLSLGAEVFYRRLMSAVDDYGLFDGRISVLKSRLYPLRHQRVSDREVERWLLECEKANLLRRYTVGDKPYVEFFGLGSPRASKPKFPPPQDAGNPTYNGMPTQTVAPYSKLERVGLGGGGCAPPKKHSRLKDLHKERGVGNDSHDGRTGGLV